MAETSVFRPRLPVPQPWLLLILAAGVGGLSLLSLAFVTIEGIPLLWLSSGFAVGLLVASAAPLRAATLGVLLLALALPAWQLGEPPLSALGYALIHSLETLVVVWGVRRYGGRLMVVEEVLRSSLVAGMATLAACTLATLLAMLLRAATRGADAVDLAATLSWFASHLIGLSVVAGLITVGLAQTARWRRRRLAACCAICRCCCCHAAVPARSLVPVRQGVREVVAHVVRVQGALNLV